MISGPHQGAEIRLPEGRSLVGCDEACDVVLNDVLVAPQHFSLDLSPGSIKISPLGGRLYCDGVWMQESENLVEPYSFLTAGGTHLLIGPSEEAWPKLSFSDIPEIEKVEEIQEKEDSDQEGDPEGDKVPKESESRPESSDPEEISAAVVGARPSQNDEDPSQRKRRAYAGIGFGLLILLIWAIAVHQMGSKEPPPSSMPEQVEVDLTDRVSAFLSESKNSETLQVKQSGPHLEIVGYVPSDQELQELKLQLSQEFPGVYPRVRSLEMIESKARKILADSSLADLKAKADSDGTLQVVGVVPPSLEGNWRAARIQLADIPGVGGEKIVSSEVKVAAASSKLEGEGNPSAIANQDTGGRAAGDAEPGQEESPPGDFLLAPSPLTDGGAEFLGPPDSALHAMPETERTIQDPAAVIEIIVSRNDGLGWVRMKSGHTLFEGSKIPTGGYIETIRENEAIIREGSSRRRVQTGDAAWRSVENAP